MSFASPFVLLALIAIPLAVLWYAGEQRQRRRAAAAFASPVLQPSVAPRRPGWRRHAPMLALLLALAVLIVAAAKPQRSVAVPVERASIMLVTDVSGSMTAKDVQPNRLVAAKRAAQAFANKVPAGVNIGVLAFNQTPVLLQSPTRDRGLVKQAIDRLSSSGGTATGEAIDASTRSLLALPKLNGKRPPSAMVLISDGASVQGRDPVLAAQAARKAKIPIYTVAYGTPQGTIVVKQRGGGTRVVPVPPDPQTLAQIARASGGQNFTAQTASGLKAVYEKLGSQLGHKKEKRQITSAFAGGGLALLLTGAAMSLGWFGRVI